MAGRRPPRVLDMNKSSLKSSSGRRAPGSGRQRRPNIGPARPGAGRWC